MAPDSVPDDLRLNFCEKLYVWMRYSLPGRFARLVNFRKIHRYIAYKSGAQLGSEVTLNGVFRGLSSRVKIGDNSGVNPGALIIGRGEVEIGRFVHIGHDIAIITSNHH